MAHIIREIQLVFNKAIGQREPKREFIKAVIVRYKGNIRVPGHPEKVYTSELGQSESLIPAINYSVQDIEGLPVILGWNTKWPHEERVIVSIDSSIPTSISLGDFSTPPHNISHEWATDASPGLDPVRIFTPAFMPLKTTVSATSLVIGVNPLYYTSGGRPLRFPGQQINLAPYLPSAGTAKYVLIYLNKNTNTAGVLSGGESPIGIPPAKPNLPTRYYEPSALILLRAGQSGINISTDYLEARNVLGADTNSFLPATQAGQILYSVNGVDMEARLPVVNAKGQIITNEAGLIIVV